MNRVWDIAATALQRLDVIDNVGGASAGGLPVGWARVCSQDALRLRGMTLSRVKLLESMKRQSASPFGLVPSPAIELRFVQLI